MGNFSAKRLEIPGLLIILPRKFKDGRGFFMETYAQGSFRELGIGSDFVQDNHSHSARRGTIRGLHYQVPPAPQAKLVRVIRGAIFDVAVDLRRGSATYGRWCAATLGADNGEQIFVPHGFAHGFCTLEPDTEVVYKVDGQFAPEFETGLRWDDPDLSIDWPVGASEVTLSDKDADLPTFAQLSSPF